MRARLVERPSPLVDVTPNLHPPTLPHAPLAVVGPSAALRTYIARCAEARSSINRLHWKNSHVKRLLALMRGRLGAESVHFSAELLLRRIDAEYPPPSPQLLRMEGGADGDSVNFPPPISPQYNPAIAVSFLGVPPVRDVNGMSEPINDVLPSLPNAPSPSSLLRDLTFDAPSVTPNGRGGGGGLDDSVQDSPSLDFSMGLMSAASFNRVIAIPPLAPPVGESFASVSGFQPRRGGGGNESLMDRMRRFWSRFEASARNGGEEQAGGGILLSLLKDDPLLTDSSFDFLTKLEVLHVEGRLLPTLRLRSAFDFLATPLGDCCPPVVESGGTGGGVHDESTAGARSAPVGRRTRADMTAELARNPALEDEIASLRTEGFASLHVGAPPPLTHFLLRAKGRPALEEWLRAHVRATRDEGLACALLPTAAAGGVVLIFIFLSSAILHFGPITLGAAGGLCLICAVALAVVSKVTPPLSPRRAAAVLFAAAIFAASSVSAIRPATVTEPILAAKMYRFAFLNIAFLALPALLRVDFRTAAAIDAALAAIYFAAPIVSMGEGVLRNDFVTMLDAFAIFMAVLT